VYIAVNPWICRGGPVLLTDKWEFINVWTICFRWWDGGNLNSGMVEVFLSQEFMAFKVYCIVV
jgi:hypothetical protein